MRHLYSVAVRMLAHTDWIQALYHLQLQKRHEWWDQTKRNALSHFDFKPFNMDLPAIDIMSDAMTEQFQTSPQDDSPCTHGWALHGHALQIKPQSLSGMSHLTNSILSVSVDELFRSTSLGIMILRAFTIFSLSPSIIIIRWFDPNGASYSDCMLITVFESVDIIFKFSQCLPAMTLTPSSGMQK